VIVANARGYDERESVSIKSLVFFINIAAADCRSDARQRLSPAFPPIWHSVQRHIVRAPRAFETDFMSEVLHYFVWGCFAPELGNLECECNLSGAKARFLSIFKGSVAERSRELSCYG